MTILLTTDSIRDTHGSHGATAISNSCAIVLLLPSTSPTIPRPLLPQKIWLSRHRQRPLPQSKQHNQQ
jgi:hypothetical protein